MKFEGKYRIEDAVSRDTYRTHLCNVHLDAKANRLVATDGHIIAVVPCEAEPGDKTGAIPGAAIRAARGVRSKDVKDPRKRIRARAGILDGGEAMFRRPSVSADSFPPYEKVMPDFKPGDKGTVTFALDAKLPVRLAAALGCGKFAMVRLTVRPDGKDNLDIIRVATGDSDVIGAIMPCRI